MKKGAFDKIIKRQYGLMVLSIIAVILLSTGITYGLYQTSHQNTTNQTISIGTLSLTKTTGTAINILDAYPISEEDITSDYPKYTFGLTNDGDYALSYQLYLEDVTSSAISSYPNYTAITSSEYAYVMYKIDDETAQTLASVYDSTTGRFNIQTGTLPADMASPSNHTITFWIAETAPNTFQGKMMSLSLKLDGTAIIEPSERTFNALNLTLGSGTPNFNSISPGDDTVGVYTAIDDYGTSYYFRGNVTNNYVKFGKNSSNQDMYWRIVRINGDGSLRLIYDGKQAYANGTNNSARLVVNGIAFNSSYNDAKYVGYMYGGAAWVASTSYAQATTNETNSTIKTYIDNWYVTNIKNTGYEDYLSDEIFCNDRSLIDGDGYGNTLTYYGARNRLYTNKTPTLICPQKNDAFTVNDTIKGNGVLTNPIGLLTADEASYAGGKWGTSNVSYYLYKGLWYWLGSASSFYASNGYAYVFFVENDGNVLNYYGLVGGGVAPVINLSAEYSMQLIGTGIATDPFRLSEN